MQHLSSQGRIHVSRCHSCNVRVSSRPGDQEWCAGCDWLICNVCRSCKLPQMRAWGWSMGAGAFGDCP